jgi:hypothetical protein
VQIVKDICTKLGMSGLTKKDLKLKSICVESALRNIDKTRFEKAHFSAKIN